MLNALTVTVVNKIRKERTAPFSINSMRRKVLYQAAQGVTVVNALGMFDVHMPRADICSGVASSVHLCRYSRCDASTISCVMKAWWPM